MSDFLNNIDDVHTEARIPSENKCLEQVTTDDVDLSVLLDFEKAQCEGEPDLIVELIDLYLAEVPQQLLMIKEFHSKGDEISLKRAVHNLKGSSANLGVISIAHLCEEIEQMNFIESLQQINTCIDRLDQSFARVSSIFLTERQIRA